MNRRIALRMLLSAAAVLCLKGGMQRGASAAESGTENPVQPDSFSLSVSGVFPGTDADACISAIYLDWAEGWYLFLPAAADRSHLTLRYETAAEEPLLLNGKEAGSGAETGLFAEADAFTMQAGDAELGTLHVMQSDLGCMYLTLGEGDRAMLDTDKDYSASGSALILAADGAVQYNGLLETVKGRGNSSWAYAPKKPYNIRLAKKASLFGMGAAKKWALLSNYLDQSLLRNEIAFAMSRQAGLDFTPDTAFADLYLDGEYRGVYQVSERVLVHPERVCITDLEAETQKLNDKPLKEYPLRVAEGTLNGEENGSYQYYEIPNDPADITGGYLIQFQLRNRAKRGEFITDRGVICEVCGPKYASKAQTEYIRGFVQELEDAIYSADGCNKRGKHYSAYLDTDSLALGYLVQEITENIDGAMTSFYFYKDSDLTGDGKLHYGPVWDFDLAFQNYSRAVTAPDGELRYSVLPEHIYARYVPVSGYSPETAEQTGITAQSWIQRLWQDDAFVRRCAVLYEERFDSYLAALTAADGIITQTAARISPAAEMNCIRWHAFGGAPYKPIGPATGESFSECVGYVRENLAKRRAFLQSDFLQESIRCCTASLKQMTGEDMAAYQAAEQLKITALQRDYTAKLAAAETAAEAERILPEAEAALAEIPRRLLCGDFNDDGSVSLEDAQTLLTYYTGTLAGKETKISATQRRNGDADQNGVLDVADAQHILQHYAAALTGKDYPLPVKTAAVQT